MAKFMKRALVSLIVWDVLVGCCILGVNVWKKNLSVGPEEKQAIIFAFVVGCAVVLLADLICGMLRRVTGSLVGFALGFAIPIFGGWIWGQLPGYFPSLPWSLLEGWGNGLMLAIPSGIAGSIVGFLQGRRTSQPPTTYSEQAH